MFCRQNMDMPRSPDWSELPPEILELVVTKLRFIIDVLRFKGVCSSFRLAARVQCSLAPLLMHQSTTHHGDYHEFGKTVRFLSPHDMNSALIYSPHGKNCLERLLDKGCCVGSSHGWLVVLDKKVNPFLSNPFSGAEIKLPEKETFPGVIDGGYRDICVTYDGFVPEISCSMEWTDGRRGWVAVPAIQKAMLTANPSYAEDYKVFAICGDGSKRISFCCRGDRTWRSLISSYKFHDVAFHNGKLYAIETDMAPPALYTPNKIRIWDLSSTFEVPQECGCIAISDFVKPLCNRFPSCIVRYYLVSSSKELFFVFRFMTANPVDRRQDFRTVGFEIYKLEREDGKEFVCVESLPSQAMFLGGNHGRVISVQDYDNKLMENSIYFTYDYKDSYLECLNYDVGIYRLENGSVNLLCDVQKKKPVPFWVFPSQK